MSNTYVHQGKRSLWDGSVTTLCGLKIREADRVWFPSLSGRAVCPACTASKTCR